MPQKNSCFKQLSKDDRTNIERWARAGKSKSEIARLLDKHRSTITRQLNNPKNLEVVNMKRSFTKQYFADLANANYTKNKKKCGAKCRADVNNGLVQFITEQLIKKRWSPKISIQYAKCNNMFREYFSDRTIYNWIRKCLINIRSKNLRYGLRYKIKPKEKENIKKMGKSITERPESVNDRSEFGHWEADCIVDKNHNAILVMQERKTRFFKMKKLEKMNSLCTFGKFNQWIAELGSAIKSITYDNGSEFALASRLPVDEYFTRPFSPHEKGGVENLNGRLRWDIPKSTNLATIPAEQVAWINENINTTPREILNYKTPKEMFDLFSKNDIISQLHQNLICCI